MLLHRAQVLVTDDDLHAVVSICAIVFLIVATVSVFGRTFTKIAVVRKLSVDDHAAFAALILCAAQTAAILIASENGLGQHLSALDDTQRNVYEKALYAAGLLFIPAIVVTKLSIVLFIRNLVPVSAHATVSLISGAGIILWGVSSEFAAAFQCRRPSSWRSGGNVCFDRLSFWNSFSILNILTDVFLVLWPSAIVYSLHTSPNRRVAVIVCFSCRFLVIGALIAQLVFTNRVAITSDPSFDLWPSVLCTQAVQALSITTACIPYLRPFLESLESGLLRSDDLRRRGEKACGYGTSKSAGKNSNLVSQVSSRRPTVADVALSVPLRPLRDIENTTTVHAETSQWEDAQSTSSQTRIIKYTTSWTVDSEPRAPDTVAEDL